LFRYKFPNYLRNKDAELCQPTKINETVVNKGGNEFLEIPATMANCAKSVALAQMKKKMAHRKIKPAI